MKKRIVAAVLSLLLAASAVPMGEFASFLPDTSITATAATVNGSVKVVAPTGQEMDVNYTVTETEGKKYLSITIPTGYFVNDGSYKAFDLEPFDVFCTTDESPVEIPREPMNDEDRKKAPMVSHPDFFSFERDFEVIRHNLTDQSAADAEGNKHYLLEEIGHRIYKRSFKFQDVDPHGLSAKFTDGQLVVCLKKFRDNNIQISFSDEPNPVCRPKK